LGTHLQLRAIHGFDSQNANRLPNFIFDVPRPAPQRDDQAETQKQSADALGAAKPNRAA
jgi:hypothetical protein